MKNKTTVFFAIRTVRDGHINLDQLAPAYAAVLSAVSGRPFTLGEPTVTHEYKDIEDYDNSRTYTYLLWGDQNFGVRAMISSLYVHHTRPGGELFYWTLYGLPARVKLGGWSKLHINWESYAELEVKGLKAKAPLYDTFTKALEAYDVLQEPKGLAIHALEHSLTQFCWYSEPLDATKEIIPLLSSAVAETRADEPHGAAVRFLLALLYLVKRNVKRATPLLDELEVQKHGLAVSHGIVCGHNEEGMPKMLAWQDYLPEKGAYYEVRSAQALAAELAGDTGRALDLYREVRDAGIKLSSDEAAKQLDRLSSV